MVNLFGKTKQNISLHFKEGERGEDAVVKDSLTTAADGTNRWICSDDFVQSYSPDFGWEVERWLQSQTNII